MSKRFLVATGPLTKAQEKAFLERVRSNAGWWHWLPNFWLVKDIRSENTFTSAALRDILKEVAPGVSCLVMEIEQSGPWASFGRKNSKGKLFASWIKETWPDSENNSDTSPSDTSPEK